MSKTSSPERPEPVPARRAGDERARKAARAAPARDRLLAPDQVHPGAAAPDRARARGLLPHGRDAARRRGAHRDGARGRRPRPAHLDGRALRAARRAASTASSSSSRPGMHMLVSTELQRDAGASSTACSAAVELREAPAEQELTEIELAIARRVLDSIVEELSRTWEELIGVTLAVDWLDVQLQNLQLAPPSEPTITLTVQIRFDELTTSLVDRRPVPLDRERGRPAADRRRRPVRHARDRRRRRRRARRLAVRDVRRAARRGRLEGALARRRARAAARRRRRARRPGRHRRDPLRRGRPRAPRPPRPPRREARGRGARAPGGVPVTPDRGARPARRDARPRRSSRRSPSSAATTSSRARSAPSRRPARPSTGSSCRVQAATVADAARPHDLRPHPERRRAARGCDRRRGPGRRHRRRSGRRSAG